MEVCQTHPGQEEPWLWVELEDDAAEARRSLISAEPELVLSGRTLAEIKAQEKNQQKYDRQENENRRSYSRGLQPGQGALSR
jgi:hypothetical protein